MASGHLPFEALEPEPARQCLAGLVERVASESLPSQTGRALRVEIPIQPVDVREWFRLQDEAQRVYWSDRTGSFEVAGVGAADVVRADGSDTDAVFETLNARLASGHPHLRYYGGLRFDPEAACGGPWRSFRTAWFVLPRFELLNAGGQCYLACNLLLDVDEQDDIVALLDRLQFDDENSTAIPHPLAREDRPDRATWATMIDRVLDRIRDAKVEKVVLARESEFRFTHAPDGAELLARLAGKADRSYCFLVQPERGTAFLGASPERLYRRQGRYIESEAVAGTRPRGQTPESDERLANELLTSEKDVREHRFVIEALRAGLGQLCGVVQETAENELLRLPECQHLHRRFEAILSEPYSDAAILRTLHPTPAVGGFPTRAALDSIRSLEPFDRGWYAGPVGWVGRDAAEFAVAIRCGLVHGRSFSAYTGAGIVPGSVAPEEWAEIENKMSNLLGVLTGDDH